MKLQPTLLASAILLMGFGIVTLFAPVEIASFLGRSGQTTSPVVVQLLGGALFAMGTLDWMNRYATIGGIFGRPVVVANLTIFFISTTTLARHALATGSGIAVWGVAAICAILAVLFARLMFSSPRGGTS